MSGGSIRLRRPGVYELRFRAGGRSISRTYRGTKEAAEKELRRLLRDIDRGGPGPTKGTAGAWFDTWLKIVRADQSPLTARLYASQVNNYLMPAFGRVRLDKMTPAMIAEWLASVTGLKPSSKRLLYRILNASLNRAVELEVIGRNPCAAIRRRLPTLEHNERPVLGPRQCATLLQAVASGPLSVVVILALATGARRGEIAAMRWADLHGDVLNVHEAMRELKASDIQRTGTKGGRARKVKLPGWAVEALRRWKVEQAEHLLRLGVRQTGATPVCTDAAGRLWTPNRITDSFGDVSRRLKLGVTFHDLRHTHASLALAAGATVKEVSGRLGHARPSMTLDIYSHVVEGVADDAAERLDQLFRATFGTECGIPE